MYINSSEITILLYIWVAQCKIVVTSYKEKIQHFCTENLTLIVKHQANTAFHKYLYMYITYTWVTETSKCSKMKDLKYKIFS